MNNEKRKLIIGSLCHDIGKVLYRDYSVTNHSDMGYAFLVNEVHIEDEEILNQVRYHHSNNIKKAKINNDSLSYITYIADNIASMSDRRYDISRNEKNEKLYDKKIRLKSIFNKLNSNDEEKFYDFGMLDDLEGIKIPIDENKIDKSRDDNFYTEVYNKILNCFNQIVDEKKEIREEYINSLLETLEATLSFVASSTDTKQVSDISLFDHLKITSAYASCIYDYVKNKKILDFKEYLYDKAKMFYDEKAFLILNLDLSGIQDFIYMHSNESGGMLKSLRTRSFYLEMLLEDVVDELLDDLELSRANVLYIGGGHSFLMLPNTEIAKDIVDKKIKEVNKWMVDTFDIRLFLAYGFEKCSANDLSNQIIEENQEVVGAKYREPEVLDNDTVGAKHCEPNCKIADGFFNNEVKNESPYSEVFRKSQISVSEKKMKKFSYDTILKLNNEQKNNGERECSICKRTDRLIEDKDDEKFKCEICKSIENISNEILNKDFFLVVSKSNDNNLKSLPLPFDKELIFKNENEAKELENRIIRLYGKNKYYTGKKLSKKINFTDYYKKGLETFEDMAKASFGGYEKLAVFRADVDNLGDAFVNGFKHNKYGTQFMSLSRIATFSRMMSLFFKKYINGICKKEFDENYIVNRDEREEFLEEKSRKKVETTSHSVVAKQEAVGERQEDVGAKHCEPDCKKADGFYTSEQKKSIGARHFAIELSFHDLAIIYSGGDDIFAVGAWDEIVNFAIELYNRFKEFSQGTLTFSCGIGMFDKSLPISMMARLSGELEDVSKSYKTKEKEKNAITLFDSPLSNEFENTYHFDEFIDNVLGEKYEIIKSYLNPKEQDGLKQNEDKGRSFLHKLIELVSNRNEKINLARFAYILARAKPNIDTNKLMSKDEKEEIIKRYNDFSEKLIKWITNEKDAKELLTALKLYGYYSREGE